MVPDKFWGLTRKAVCHTNDSFERTKYSHQEEAGREDNWIPII
jgi:hypothetical protein